MTQQAFTWPLLRNLNATKYTSDFLHWHFFFDNVYEFVQYCLLSVCTVVRTYFPVLIGSLGIEIRYLTFCVSMV